MTFARWIEEERLYLNAKKSEPEVDVLGVEYVELLNKYHAARYFGLFAVCEMIICLWTITGSFGKHLSPCAWPPHGPKTSPGCTRCPTMHGRVSYTSKLNYKVLRSACKLASDGHLTVLNIKVLPNIYAFKLINVQ